MLSPRCNAKRCYTGCRVPQSKTHDCPGTPLVADRAGNSPPSGTLFVFSQHCEFEFYINNNPCFTKFGGHRLLHSPLFAHSAISQVTMFLVAVFVAGAATSAWAACGGDKPLSLCCMGLAPWSTNSNVWGNICGYTPSDPNELIGGRCIYLSSGSWCVHFRLHQRILI